MDRRRFLAGAGLVVAGGAAGAGTAAAAEPGLSASLSAPSPTARTATPSGPGACAATVVFRAAPAARLVALTLDDGPTRQWTPQVLAMLARYGARATFFRVGARAREAPDLVARTAEAGHEQGNHTWAHDDLTRHDETFDRRTLERTHVALTRLAGQAPTSCRPPWGRIDSVGLAVCADLRYSVTLWSHHVTGSNPRSDVDTILRRASPGSIVLAHDGGSEPNPRLMTELDRLLASMTASGYRFVTVSELLSGSAVMPGLKRIAVAAVALLLPAALVAVSSASARPLVLTVAGVAQDPCQPERALVVPAGLSGRFEPDSAVLLTAGGIYAAPGRSVPLTGALSACAAAAERADRDWLRAGVVPGATAAQRALAVRALLDLKLAVQPDGAVLAGWRHAWDYAWPRDSSWVAVALADTGHSDLAYQIFRFLRRVQAPDGTWAARYLPDGRPVRDGRPAELDAVGWVPWAVWSWVRAGPAVPPWMAAAFWPMVARAADAAARSLTRDGLPGPAMDYWEDSVQVTLGTAAPLLAGLRAAASLAGYLGQDAAGRRWTAAAGRLARAVTAGFGSGGYQRTPAAASGADAAITFLGPPFARPDPRLLRAAASAQRALTLPNGGLRPGGRWPGAPGVAWTAETAFFALFDAATGQHQRAAALLAWLAAHRTSLGALPEQVSLDGQPVVVAPLAWTDAVVLLTLLAQAAGPWSPMPGP